jgi:hypothetical protein
MSIVSGVKIISMHRGHKEIGGFEKMMLQCGCGTKTAPKVRKGI